jgi:hypothetical protein
MLASLIFIKFCWLVQLYLRVVMICPILVSSAFIPNDFQRDKGHRPIVNYGCRGIAWFTK